MTPEERQLYEIHKRHRIELHRQEGHGSYVVGILIVLALLIWLGYVAYK